MPRRSLTRRLIVGVLLAELACAAALSGLAIWREERGLRHAFDIMIRGRADSVLGAVRDAEDPEDNVLVDPTELAVPPHDAYAVLSPTGRELGRSPGTPAPLIADLEHPRPEGFFSLRAGRERYRAVRFAAMRVIDREEGNGGLRRPIVVLYASPTRSIWREAVEAARWSVLGSAALFALTAIVLTWFLRRSLHPLHELAHAADRVSIQSWEFVPPRAALDTRELAPIAASIRDLLAGLERAFQRQRQFTGDAAHELKTSVAVLKSSLQLLTMRRRTAEQYEAGLRDLTLDLRRMEELVEGMLALARLEETTPAAPARTDLRAIVLSVAERLQPLAESRRVHIRTLTDTPASVPLHDEDARVLSSNLILNAVQHSPETADVTVSITRQPGQTILEVADHGPGIPPEALPHLFQRFYRTDASRSRESGGAGLGLAICKAIVDRSHGSITLASTTATGTTVRVILPHTSPTPTNNQHNRTPGAPPSRT